MSVCTFSAEELANIAHVIITGAPEYQNWETRIATLCQSLALVSQANYACFNDRYAHHNASARPHSPNEIRAELIRIDSAPGNAKALARALNTATLLHYNCDDSGGDFTLKVEGAHAALIGVLEGLCAALARKAGLNP